MLKYGNSRFQPYHINYVLVETWEAFTVSSGNIIMDRFYKTQILHLIPPNIKTNTQTFVASIQTSLKVINQSAEDTRAPIQLLKTSTNDPMVVPERNVLLGNHRETFFSGS